MLKKKVRAELVKVRYYCWAISFGFVSDQENETLVVETLEFESPRETPVGDVDRRSSRIIMSSREGQGEKRKV